MYRLVTSSNMFSKIKKRFFSWHYGSYFEIDRILSIMNTKKTTGYSEKTYNKGDTMGVHIAKNDLYLR